MPTRTEVHVWKKTIELLQTLSAAHLNDAYDEHHGLVGMPCGHPEEPRRSSRFGKVTIVERSEPRKVTVAWNDPAACFYGDQVWKVGVARQAGVCALSGCGIRPGDAVYRPTSTRPAALNAEAMILATIVESGQIETSASKSPSRSLA
jgi:hypothetical protein